MVPQVRVCLPPLILDGDAKVLQKMTIKELDSCLRAAIKACGGTLSHLTAPPPWWPIKKFSWEKDFSKHLDSKHEKNLVYRHLLTACYSYYKQLEILHLFDVEPRSRPKWTLLEKDDGYQLIILPSQKVVAFYSSQEATKILPLIAVAAQQLDFYSSDADNRVKKSNRRVRSTLPPSNGSTDDQNFSDKSQNGCALRSSYPNNAFYSFNKNFYFCEKTRKILQNANCRSTQSSSMASSICGDSRQNSVSILGSWSPRRASVVSVDQNVNIKSNQSISCNLCKIYRCAREKDLLTHTVLCKNSTTARCAKDKITFLSNLHLVPRRLYDSFKNSVDDHKKIKCLAAKLNAENIKFLSKSFSLTTLFGGYDFDKRKCRKFRFLNPDYYAGRNVSNAHSFSRSYFNDEKCNSADSKAPFFPVIFRRSLSPTYSHVYTFCTKDRERRIARIRREHKKQRKLEAKIFKYSPSISAKSTVFEWPAFPLKQCSVRVQDLISVRQTLVGGVDDQQKSSKSIQLRHRRRRSSQNTNSSISGSTKFSSDFSSDNSFNKKSIGRNRSRVVAFARRTKLKRESQTAISQCLCCDRETKFIPHLGKVLICFQPVREVSSICYNTNKSARNQPFFINARPNAGLSSPMADSFCLFFRFFCSNFLPLTGSSL